MYKNIREKLLSLKQAPLIAVIAEGRSRKIQKKCVIDGVYNRIFTIKVDNKIMCFSYSDLICKTIILQKII